MRISHKIKYILITTFVLNIYTNNYYYLKYEYIAYIALDNLYKFCL